MRGQASPQFHQLHDCPGSVHLCAAVGGGSTGCSPEVAVLGDGCHGPDEGVVGPAVVHVPPQVLGEVHQVPEDLIGVQHLKDLCSL